ncbi:hypothetical protein IC757_12385 [Wenzhouxiangella sp. AB-CW3]|uniref:hypothetical protein n=1 Tax=Wenzhouxiangella sp. AB-CW3 TaxID=2771012 RepID=UPI00168BD25E|nr:hypothetical protein [Wenzhouxiangella sp. AB-CW3]QOC21823.1 hypothetical protein IC757_12385 [Wenzhouxiangella sp. AB-CW3]
MKYLSSFLILLGLGLAVSVDEARATPTHECSSGCFIVTCSGGGDCSLYYCSGATGCDKITDFIRPNSSPVPNPGEMSSTQSGHEGIQFDSIAGTASQPGSGPSCGMNPCTVRLCDADYCELWGFRNGSAYQLGSGQNLDAWFETLSEEFVD